MKLISNAPHNRMGYNSVLFIFATKSLAAAESCRMRWSLCRMQPVELAVFDLLLALV
jgi:hypothetical protein